MATENQPASDLGSRHAVRIYGHSTLLYWWPVWVVGFICGIISLAYPRILVPANSKVDEVAYENKVTRAVILPEGRKLDEHRLFISPSPSLGVAFCVTILVVVTITNVSLRGLWSIIVLSVIFFVSIIFAILDWWAPILETLSFLDIRINAGGYFLLSGVLFVLWCVIIFLFDRQTYIIFSPAQFRVRQEIGDAETAYDTLGIQVEKKRTDFFRHWILGLGSGDLVVRTAGAQPHVFEMSNVLFLGYKASQINKIIFAKTMVTADSK